MQNGAIRGAVRATQLAIIMAVALLVGGQVLAAQPGSEMQIKEIEQLYLDFGVSASVRAGDFLYIGGIVAFDGEGKAIGPYDGKRQIEVIYQRIGKLLKAHGADAKNVVNETIYHTGWQHVTAGAEIRKAFYDTAKAAYPTAAGIQVVALADPTLVLEIVVVAYLGK